MPCGIKIPDMQGRPGDYFKTCTGYNIHKITGSLSEANLQFCDFSKEVRVIRNYKLMSYHKKSVLLSGEFYVCQCKVIPTCI